jgi:GntR family transcriptional repressor for pyruvate dehydrogenase complex
MPLSPVTRRSVTDEVYDQILATVIAGELAPGAPLPSERRLAEVLGVSRPVVREALQRMTHAGLVEVRQGGSTTVRDFRRTAGLDLLPRLLVHDGELDLAVARSILEARQAVAPEIAALAAARVTPALVTRLHDTVAALAAATGPVVLQLHALDFWEHLADGADSVVFRLMYNSLRAAYEPAVEALAPLLEEEVSQLDGYRQILAAVEAGDADAARARATDLLAPATASLLAALTALEGS